MALCGVHYKECKDLIDRSKMSNIFSKFDDPYVEKGQKAPTDDSIICNECLDILKIEEPDASKGGTNDEVEVLVEPNSASNEAGAKKASRNAKKTVEKKAGRPNDPVGGKDR